MRRYCCIIGVCAASVAAGSSRRGCDTVARDDERSVVVIAGRPLPAFGAALAAGLAGRVATDRREPLEQLHQLRVDLRIAGDDLALVEEVGLAGEVADQTAGLGDEERAGGDVPRR